MRLLVLGGTLFLGRHLVDAALARGHEVTVFTRGRRALPWPAGVRALVGDRDPRVAPGLAALEGDDWDAVVDTSGYLPRVVGASVDSLRGRVRRYVFISSVSVYADTAAKASARTRRSPRSPIRRARTCLATTGRSRRRARRGCARASATRPRSSVPASSSGRTILPTASPTGPRASCIRELLGDRAPRAVVPAPPARPIQVIDARDLAAFTLGLVERDVAGTFNACSPAGRFSFRDLVDACLASAASPPAPAWIDEATLAAHHVEPWTGLPLWIPSTEADAAGFMTIDTARAEREGLRARPLVETVRDTAAWLLERDNAGAWKVVLRSDARERLVLSRARRLTPVPRRRGPPFVERGSRHPTHWRACGSCLR